MPDTDLILVLSVPFTFTALISGFLLFCFNLSLDPRVSGWLQSTQRLNLAQTT
jgi:hypothetical protein